MNLQHVFDDHVAPDMTFAEFEKICRECWGDKFGVMVIVKDFDIGNGRYRKGFDHYISV